ncbi:MAG: TetR/AcrR family transcriptional regulator [Lachnospiraceae bacterium]|nr:TetR/AcrR family transcriptional regulator [Lachnospiraceae bacterium]
MGENGEEMPYSYDLTHENILKSAAEHFKNEGFREASIRSICHDAGVTNGAFYAHFNSKEDLFNDLVGDAIDGLNKIYSEEEDEYESVRNTEDILKAFKKTYLSTDKLIRYMCTKREPLLLVVESSGGTGYEYFKDMLIDNEIENMKQFLELCKPHVKSIEAISDNIIRLGTTFLVDSIFNGLKKGMTAEEIIEEIKAVSEYCIAGYRKLMEI